MSKSRAFHVRLGTPHFEQFLETTLKNSTLKLIG
jgi:hypothetical protein